MADTARAMRLGAEVPVSEFLTRASGTLQILPERVDVTELFKPLGILHVAGEAWAHADGIAVWDILRPRLFQRSPR